jgi:hypothetical protein
LAGSSVAINAWPNIDAISGLVAGPLDRLPQHRQRLGGIARFQQDLPLQFHEERIVRPLGEQAFHLGHGALRIGTPVQREGTGVAGRMERLLSG